MLRFLSNYIFQSEEPKEDDTSTNLKQESQNTNRNQDTQYDDDDAEDYERNRKDVLDGEDDWVIIGNNGDNKQSKNVRTQGGSSSSSSSNDEGKRVDFARQVQLLSLVAENPKEEENSDLNNGGLLWEDKLIEHASMSVYMDLPPSMPTTSPSENSFQEVTFKDAPVLAPGHSDKHNTIVISREAIYASEPTKNPSDMENNVNTKSSATKNKPATTTAAAASTNNNNNNNNVQNGRKRKGHYPFASNKPGQIPRRYQLRSAAGGNSRVHQSSQTFWAPENNKIQSSADDSVELPESLSSATNADKKLPTAANNNNDASSASPYGYAKVGSGFITAAGTPPSAPNNMFHKNLKVNQMVQSARAASIAKQVLAGSKKANTTTKGHFLQESRRRQDLQKYTKHSYANNNRKSAHQRPPPNRGCSVAGGAGSRSSNNSK